MFRDTLIRDAMSAEGRAIGTTWNVDQFPIAWNGTGQCDSCMMRAIGITWDWDYLLVGAAFIRATVQSYTFTCCRTVQFKLTVVLDGHVTLCFKVYIRPLYFSLVLTIRAKYAAYIVAAQCDNAQQCRNLPSKEWQLQAFLLEKTYTENWDTWIQPNAEDGQDKRSQKYT